jgi:hypothetical protein
MTAPDPLEPAAIRQDPPPTLPSAPPKDPPLPSDQPDGIGEPDDSDEEDEDPDGNIIHPPIDDPETETEEGIGRDRHRPDRGIE